MLKYKKSRITNPIDSEIAYLIQTNNKNPLYSSR
jgi:hypothetical protein